MGDMPYSVDKGQGLTTVEGMLNYAGEQVAISFVQRWRFIAGAAAEPEDRTHNLVDVMDDLLSGGALPAWDAPGDYVGGKSLKQHLHDEWFGGSTGQNFFLKLIGDVEGVIGEALCRAIEISLGIQIPPSGTAVPTPLRQWPISLWWTCPAPRFDVHLSWEGEVTGDGSVTAVVLTPGITGGALFQTLNLDPTQINPGGAYGQYHLDEEDADGFSPAPAMDSPPLYGGNGITYAERTSGCWIVSATETKTIGAAIVLQPEPSGQWTIEGFSEIKLEGPPSVVSPAYKSGGVKA